MSHESMPSELGAVNPHDHRHLAAYLGETDPRALRGLKSILRQLGWDAVQDLLAETTRIEETGGMPSLDGQKRRTMGGVFFRLVKERHPKLRWPRSSKRYQQAAKRAQVYFDQMGETISALARAGKHVAVQSCPALTAESLDAVERVIFDQPQEPIVPAFLVEMSPADRQDFVRRFNGPEGARIAQEIIADPATPPDVAAFGRAFEAAAQHPGGPPSGPRPRPRRTTFDPRKAIQQEPEVVVRKRGGAK